MQNPLDEDETLDEEFDDTLEGMDTGHMSTDLLWQLVHQPFPGSSRKAIYLNGIQQTMSQLLPNDIHPWVPNHEGSVSIMNFSHRQNLNIFQN